MLLAADEQRPLLNKPEQQLSAKRSRHRLVWIAVALALCAITWIVGDAITSLQKSSPRGHSEAASRRRTMTLHSLEAYPNAICNDGSPGALYIDRSASSHTWIIFFQGGGWCTELPCIHRQGLTSTLNLSDSLDVMPGSLFDSAIPGLADANTVYAAYCSSDAWIGNNTVDTGFAFHGAAIFDATLDFLLDDLLKADLVLVAGSSAGARGVVYNYDRVLRSKLGDTVDLRLLLDSAVWLDAPQVRDDVEKFTSLSHPPIAEDFLVTSNALGTLSDVDIALLEFQFDRIALHESLPPGHEVSEPELQEEQTNMTAFLLDFARSRNTRMTLIFSPACHDHIMLTLSQRLNLYRVGDLRLSHALGKFLSRSQERTINIEACTGSNCGAACKYTD